MELPVVQEQLENTITNYIDVPTSKNTIIIDTRLWETNVTIGIASKSWNSYREHNEQFVYTDVSTTNTEIKLSISATQRSFLGKSKL